jgi:signal transduction histidine kinase
VANKAAHDHERARWESVDAKRKTLQTLLVREFPRPLRALEWFSRTFEEPLLRNSTEAMRTQFRALRHHIQEVTFLGTDLLQLGVMDTGGVRFERRRINLAEVLTEAADGSSARARVLLSLTNQPITVVADADRLRQAFACLIDRSLELSPHDDVTVLTRVSADEAAVEVSSRARELEDADVELSRLLVVGNGGRLVLISRGAMRGSLATVHLPLDQNPRNSSAEEVAAQGRVAE